MFAFRGQFEEGVPNRSTPHFLTHTTSSTMRPKHPPTCHGSKLRTRHHETTFVILLDICLLRQDFLSPLASDALPLIGWSIARDYASRTILHTTTRRHADIRECCDKSHMKANDRSRCRLGLEIKSCFPALRWSISICTLRHRVDCNLRLIHGPRTTIGLQLHI